MFEPAKPNAVASTFTRQIVEFNRPRRMGPNNVLVLYRSGDSVGQSIAEMYQAKRGIPPSNVQAITLPWDPGAGNYATLADMDTAVGQVAALCLARDVYSLLLCGWWPVGAGVWTLNELFGFCHLFAVLGSGNTTFSNISYWSGYTLAPYISRWHPDFSSDYAQWWLNVDTLGINGTAPYFGVVPKNRLSLIADKTQVFYPTFRLEGPPDADQLTFCTRIVDDSIAAEKAEYADLGVALVDGSGDITAGRPMYNEITEFGIPTKDFRWRQLNVSTEFNTGTGYPSLSDTWTTRSGPGATGFVAQSDVFLKYIGSESYYGGKTVPETSADYQYRTGAVTAFGQSFGYQPPVWADCGWWNQTPKWASATGLAATGAAQPQAINSIGAKSSPIGIVSTGTSPTVDVLADGTFILKESGTQVGLVAPQASFDAYLSVSLPTGWTIGTSLPGSRALSAVRAGAVCAMGAIVEPYTTGMPKSYHMAQGLWSGDSLGELAFKLHSPGAYDALDSTQSHGLTILGDPLYRPFGWRIR